MNATITISDCDRRIDWRLAVSYDFLPGTRARAGWRNGGDPGEGPAVEIAAVRCLEMAVWCGDRAVSAWPGLDERQCQEKKIGAWCLEHYPEAIEEELLEIILARRDGRGDGGDNF